MRNLPSKRKRRRRPLRLDQGGRPETGERPVEAVQGLIRPCHILSRENKKQDQFNADQQTEFTNLRDFSGNVSLNKTFPLSRQKLALIRL